jgi:hypothetical protein
MGTHMYKKLAWSHKIENAYKFLVCFKSYFVLRDTTSKCVFHDYVSN